MARDAGVAGATKVEVLLDDAGAGAGAGASAGAGVGATAGSGATCGASLAGSTAGAEVTGVVAGIETEVSTFCFSLGGVSAGFATAASGAAFGSSELSFKPGKRSGVLSLSLASFESESFSSFSSGEGVIKVPAGVGMAT